ncbi:MAG: NeuD/PglB/VioB family sugar acetyltransferase [Gemmatimonadota bacterium]
MTRRVVLIGGGEHAGVVAEVMRSLGDAVTVLGFLDPDPAARVADLAHLGADEALPSLGKPWAVLGFGAPGDVAARRSAVEAAAAHVEGWMTVVHRAAWVSPSAVIGAGAVILPGAIVHTRASVGAHAIVNSRSVIEHDVALGDFVHVAPGAVIGGGAIVAAGAFVGLGAVVRDHTHIGEEAVVGMGAVVVSAVGAGRTVLGNPARPA